MFELQTVVRNLSQVAMRDRRLFGEICGAMADCLTHNPSAYQAVVRMCILYLHMGPFARRVVAEMDSAISWEDAHAGGEAAVPPQPKPGEKEQRVNGTNLDSDTDKFIESPKVFASGPE